MTTNRNAVKATIAVTTAITLTLTLSGCISNPLQELAEKAQQGA